MCLVFSFLFFAQPILLVIFGCFIFVHVPTLVYFFLRFVRYLFESARALLELPAGASTTLNPTTLLGTRVAAIEARLDSTVEFQNLEYAKREEETDGRLNET